MRWLVVVALVACDAGTPPRVCTGLAALEKAADWTALEREARTCHDAVAEQVALAMQGRFHDALALAPRTPRIDRVTLLVLDGDLRGAARATTDRCMAELFTRIATPTERRPETVTCPSTEQMLSPATIQFIPWVTARRPLAERAHEYGDGEMISGIRSRDTLSTLLADGKPIDCKDWGDTCPALRADRDTGDGRPLAKIAARVSYADIALVAPFVTTGRAELGRAIHELRADDAIEQFPITTLKALADRGELYAIFDLDHADIDRRLARFEAATADLEHLVALLALQYPGGVR